MAAKVLLASVLPLACTAGCGPAEQTPREALLDPSRPVWTEAAPEVSRVRLLTTEGEILIELRRDWAPFGVDRFYQLVRSGYYDDSRFFRVRSGYITQFGIAGEPEIAGLWRAQTIVDDPVGASNLRGTLAFAMTGPDTRSTRDLHQ